MRDPFAAQVRLSRMHTRLVPMQRTGVGYSIDPAAAGWFELPASRGFAGYGLARALGLLLDAMGGLSALNETTTESGEAFSHGEFTPLQFRVDPLGVCRLVPLTTRHYESEHVAPPRVSLGFLSPERLIAEKVGLRADVFSAGVLLWEALAGRRLIDADRAEIIVEQWLSRPIRVPALPPQLDWAAPLKAEVERALCVNQQRRFADCAEFSQVILRLVQDRVASHDEIAAFFRSNFNASPIAEGSSPGPASVSRELQIANRSATVRMLPAVSLAPAIPHVRQSEEAAPLRHATLKMNVTLRMAHVPPPIPVEEPPQPSAPPRSFTPPLLPLSYPPQRPSPPPLSPVPARRSSPPPLPPMPRTRQLSPPPLHSLANTRQSSPPSLSVPLLTSDSLAELTIPSPPLVEFEQPEAVARAQRLAAAAASATELGSTTPVPTQISFLHPSIVSSIPPTTTEPAQDQQPHRTSPKRSLAALVAVAVTLIAAATAAVKSATSRATQPSTASARIGARRSVSASIDNSGSASGSPRADAASSKVSADTPLSVETNPRVDPSTRVPEVTPNAAHSPMPAVRPPPARPARSGALPRGKDYGI